MLRWLTCILAITKDLPLQRGSISSYSLFLLLSIHQYSMFLVCLSLSFTSSSHLTNFCFIFTSHLISFVTSLCSLPPSRFWTESYAMPRGEVAGNEAHPAVRRLVEMGFAEEDCRQALLTHKGNAFISSKPLFLSLVNFIFVFILGTDVPCLFIFAFFYIFVLNDFC